MAHIFRLHVGTPGTIGDLARYLKDHGLVSNMSQMQTNSIQVEVGNKANFERYLKMKARESTDPGWDILAYEYLGETGKAMPRSKEGRLAQARVTNFIRGKKKH